MRVFRVRSDLKNDRFQTFHIDGDDDFSWPWFDLMTSPNPVSHVWSPPPLYADRPTLRVLISSTYGAGVAQCWRQPFPMNFETC